MTSENESKFKVFLWEIKKEYLPLLAAFIYLLVFAFSIIYMLNSKAFNETYEPLIISLEVFSATFAFITFTLDRFSLLENFPKICRWITNIITLVFFLITLPHLLADGAIKMAAYPLVFKIIITSSILILFSCFLYVFLIINKFSLWVNIIASALTTIGILILLGLALHYTYGDIQLF